MDLIVATEDPRGEAARQLLDAMCAELSSRYGRPPSLFRVEECMTPRTAFIVARLDGQPVGCGALRAIDDKTVELKRMFVVPAARRCGIARRILAEAEALAWDFGYGEIILETGVFQPEALVLYRSVGYYSTPAYGRYVGNPDAFCFAKKGPRLRW